MERRRVETTAAAAATTGTAGRAAAAGRATTAGNAAAAATAGMAAVALLLAAPAPAQEAADAPRTFRYSMEVTAPQASAPATWHAFQGPEGAALVPPNRRAEPGEAWAIFHEARTGGRPYQVRREDRRLIPVWHPDEEYRPGVEVESGQAILSLRELEWELIRGSSDRRIAGRPTEHHVFTASVMVELRPGPGLGGLGTDSARVVTRTDLWIDPSLPFSWAPFATWGSRALSLGQPVADDHLRREVGPRLREMGLPLRMETRLTYRPFGDPDFAFGQNARTRVRVTEVQPVEPPAVPPRFLRYERMNESQ